MTPIEVLLSLGIHDAAVARRMQVSRMTVSRWRAKSRKPMNQHQDTARAYLAEIQSQITFGLTADLRSRAA